jgi:hypothetical protein
VGEAKSKQKEVEKGEEERTKKRSEERSPPAGPEGLADKGKVKPVKKQSKGLVHKPGGRMTPDNSIPGAGGKSTKGEGSSRGRRVYKSVPVMEESEDEVVKGKRKAAAKADARVKASREAEAVGSEDNDDEASDGDEDEENDAAKPPNSKTVMEKVRERAEIKSKANSPPGHYVAVEERDKCGQCAKLQTACHWIPGALKKVGPKACWQCKCRKTGCTPSFRASGPIQVDLSTPLDDLVDRLAPPPSGSDGIPRAGILGEATVPMTLGELLVDILSEVRSMREENRELKKEIDIINRTLVTTSTYDVKYHQDVMETLQGLPGTLGHALGEQIKGLPESIHRRITKSLVLPAGILPAASSLGLEPHPIPKRAAPSISISPPAPHSPFGSPLSPIPLTLNIRDDLPGLDEFEEATNEPAAATATARGPPPGLNSSVIPLVVVDDGDHEDIAVPSAVANHTRRKTKAAAPSPAVADEDSDSDSSTPLQDIGKASRHLNARGRPTKMRRRRRSRRRRPSPLQRPRLLGASRSPQQSRCLDPSLY